MNTVHIANTCAYCTLVMCSDEYVLSATVLAKSLKSVDAKYPSICMVTDDVSSDGVSLLRKYFSEVILVPYISHEVIKMSRKQESIYGRWIHHSFTKWNIFNPDVIVYDKVLLMDADMVVIENIDDLFDLDAPAATFSSPWAYPYAATTALPIHNPYYDYKRKCELAHGEAVSIRALKRGLNASPYRLTIAPMASMVLISPSYELKKSLDDLLSGDAPYGHPKCASGFDEQALLECIIGLHPRNIHQMYNWMVGKTKWLGTGTDTNIHPKTYHYYNVKPWQTSRDAWIDLAVWWKYADEIINEESGVSNDVPITSTYNDTITTIITDTTDTTNKKQNYKELSDIK